MLRERPEDLAQAVALTPYAEEEYKQAKDRDGVDPLERARRLCVRSWMGHGGNAATSRAGFRRNTTRRGTIPATDWHRFPAAIADVAERLRGVVIECRQACEVMRAHDSLETLHYVDPPYLPDTRDKGRDYTHEMTAEDHIALADVLHSLQGMVVLSAYPSQMYSDLYTGWRQVQRIAHADSTAERLEVLWLSPNCPSQGLFASA